MEVDGTQVAEELKNRGNELFKRARPGGICHFSWTSPPALTPRLIADKHFAAAVEAYTGALELLPSAVLFANRAAAHLALEAYGSALADAEKSVEADPTYVKARAATGRGLWICCFRRPLARPADAVSTTPTGLLSPRCSSIPATQASRGAEGLPAGARQGQSTAQGSTRLLTPSSRLHRLPSCGRATRTH
jgi:hypothetical protein